MRVHERMQIGEIAEHTGLSLRTIRYYEEVGLSVPSARSPGGFRLYSPDDLERLMLLKKMKPAGLQLTEIRELLAILDTPAAERDASDRAGLDRFADTADRQRAILEQRLETVTELVDMLRRAGAAAH